MIERILAELDNEIFHLQRVRSLLTREETKPAATKPASKPAKRRKWKMSGAGRKRIADAQRARWAKQKSGE